MEISSFYICVLKIMIRWCTISEIWCVTDVIIFHFGPLFCPFTARKIKILKNEKSPGHIIILHMCTKNYDQMMYGSWDMVHDRCIIIFHFGPLYPFYPPSNPKNQHFEKMKKCLEISSFYICVSKFMIRWCVVPEIWCMTDRQTEGRMEKATYRGGCPT